jgi:hypothetical protein
MIDKSKIIILVTGTTIEPHAQNWKECSNTWIPELKKMGYNIMVAIGDPNLESWFEIKDDIIWFKAEDTKMGLYDKSIRLPIKWILENTQYEYYFRIDSDSFVEPNKFDEMMTQNISEIPNMDYMGCCHPANNWNPHISFKTTVCKPRYIASGCAYMISRRAMEIADKMMRIDEPVDYTIDDWVLGRAMWENHIPLVHDSRIIFESKYNRLAEDPHNIGLPDIEDPSSHLAIQHYMNGHMEEAMVSLGYRK